jgi:hypothetical protein
MVALDTPAWFRSVMEPTTTASLAPCARTVDDKRRESERRKIGA